MPAWKRWLGYAARPRGRFVVDAGARQAVQTQGRSLLPIGVMQVVGAFHKGDVVALCDAEGVEFAVGAQDEDDLVLHVHREAAEHGAGVG